MPIHDQGYRRYSGRRGSHRRVWWVIARTGILQYLREPRFLGFLLIAWVPFGVRAVQMYAATHFDEASFLAPSATMFREFLDQQSLLVFFITIYAGAGLIADDRRVHALQIYLSKPLTRAEYLTGKLLILVLVLAAVTWVPAMLLLLLQVVFTGSTAFIQDNLFLIPATTAFCALHVFMSAVVMLALSSLSSSRRFVAVLYAGAIFLPAAVYQMLRLITGSRAWAAISAEELFDVLADALFRMPGERAFPVGLALVTLAALAAGSVLILHRRVRAVEVVN